MRILFQTRHDYMSNMAGDTIQLLRTKEHLEQLGVKIDISTQITDTRPYDLVHLFNTTRVAETYNFFQAARSHGSKVVISTIYWDMTEFLLHANQPAAMLASWQATEKYRQVIFRDAQMLLPNSWSELSLIKEKYDRVADHHIVPNGAEKILFSQAAGRYFFEKYGLKDFVLCVGRISRRKNQLALARALRGAGLELVLLGPVNDRTYGNLCRQAGSHVTMINFMEHHLLPSAYACARVHVLPSWFETPGLANLEAALAGCAVVSTNRGSARDYFGELARYCSPDDQNSIKRAVLGAYECRIARQGFLRDYVMCNFTWEAAARETLTAYRKIL